VKVGEVNKSGRRTKFSLESEDVGRGNVGSNATCVLGSDQSSEIMRKWEEGIIGSSVNPVIKDRALTTPFL